MKTTMSLVLAIGVMGCGGATYTAPIVHVEEQDVGLFETAAAEWNETCGTHIVITTGDGIVVAKYVTHIDNGPVAKGFHFGGEYDYDHDLLLYNDRHDGTVIAHELGHMLGLHGHQTHGLMQPVAEGHVTQFECSLLDPVHGE